MSNHAKTQCYHCGTELPSRYSMEVAAVAVWEGGTRVWCRKCWDNCDDALLEYQGTPLPTRNDFLRILDSEVYEK